MVLNRLLISTICLILFNGLQAQKGKDGSKTISTANVIVNEFTALTASVAVNSTILNVTANGLNANARFTSSLTAGDLVMIIQMQGAKMNLGTYAVPWQPDSAYGKIYDYASCGNYEFAEVKSTISTNQIELTCGLTYSYNNTGKTQIVRVPRYSSLNVTGTGVLTTDAWNSTNGIGGVLTVEVDGNTTVDGVVTATGLGFKGGTAIGNGGSGNSNFVTKNPNDGAEKGEGIGSNRLDNTLAIDSLGKQCKGSPANGGGGGNANNCGGGGGANGGNINVWYGYGITNTTYSVAFNLEWPTRSSLISSGGGKGGYGTSTVSTNDPNIVGPNNIAWGSTKRPSYGGFGGRPLDYSSGKIFMGGGGGAGHMSTGQSNGANACSGGAGGGLIYLLNYGAISGIGNINSNGANGNSAFGSANFTNPQQGIDGAGGAGAGGTIILKSNGTISGVTANANGGNGGNQIKSGTTNSEGQGPGGGGSGGYIAGNGSVFTQNVNGGVNGTTNASAFDIEFPMNGATSGDAGTKNQVVSPSFSLTASANQTLCTNQSATLTASSTNTSSTIEWYNTLNGTAVSSGTVYVTPTYTATGTYTVYAGSCPGIYRLPILITVNNGVTLTVNSATICPNQTVTLTASGATTYTWNTGPNTNSISVSPSSTTVYTISGSSGSCTASKTSTVIVSSTPTVVVSNTTICLGNTTTLTASGATNYTWMPGGQTTTSIAATPTTNTTYTITGSNGTCTNSTTATVSITPTPTLSANSQTICSGQVATFTVSGATSYTWNPGGVTGSTYTINPVSSTTVSVVGANASCTAQITPSVTVNPTPTLAVTNQTICPSQTVTLTASGATTYTWNTGQNTNTISVSPSSTTVYTVSGTTNNCSGTNTVAVTVASQPTLTVSGNTAICSGNSSTLTASGATSYTWMPGGQTTTSIAVTPTTNTTYTITGSNGVCTNTLITTMSVTSTPTLVPVSATICPSQTATLTVSGAAGYTWSPGNITGNTYTIAPSSSTVVTIIGANGTCTTQTTATVTVGSGISISVNSPTICAGQTASLTASGANTYTWNTGAFTNTLNVNPASTTIYTVSGAVGTCTGISTSTVTVIGQPTISVSGNTPICSGATATLIASGAISYTWAPGGQLTSIITDNPNNTVTYTVTGSDGTCSNNITATLIVTATPTLTAQSLTICAGQTATLTGSGASTYTWNPGNIIGNSYTLSPVSTTTVDMIGANGSCTSQITHTVNVGAALSVAINSQTICEGQTTVLSATTSASSYTWNTGANTSSISVSPDTNSVYTLDVSNGSCVGSNTVAVTVNAAPTLTAAATANNICNGQTTTLTAMGADTYTWSNGSNNNIQNVSPSSTTIYTVIGTSLAGCTSTVFTSTTINVTAIPNVSITSSPTICAGQTATLIATGATSYTWSTTQNDSSITVTPTNNQSYSVTGDIGGCIASYTALVTITPSPSVTVNAVNTTGCSGLLVSFTDNVSPSSSTISYNFGDGATDNINNPTHNYTASGSYTVTATVTNTTLGCSSTYTLPTVIQVISAPVADFIIQEGSVVTVNSVINLTNSSTNATSYLWSLCGSVSTLTNVTTSFADTGSCCITLLASNSTCTNSVTKCITIVDEAIVVIPNVFTPNGDGSNELFKITSTGIKNLNCTIYDRWGLKMYDWEGINGSWDGNTKIGGAPSGTYFYIINYTDQLGTTTTEKGFLNLFRD